LRIVKGNQRVTWTIGQDAVISVIDLNSEGWKYQPIAFVITNKRTVRAPAVMNLDRKEKGLFKSGMW
jgi:hypothetical protein